MKLSREEVQASEYATLATEQCNKFGLNLLDLSAFKKLSTLPSDVTALQGLKAIKLDGTQVEDLTPLARLSALEKLSAKNTRVRSIPASHSLQQLKELCLDRTQVSDLRPVADMQSLESLSLRRTPVRNLDGIQFLSHLKRLDLYWTKILDVSALTEIHSLIRLRLSRTKVEDLRPLSALENLRVLELDRTPVLDLSPLVGMPLETLIIDNTKIVDLTPLAKMTSLSDKYAENRWQAGLRCWGVQSARDIVGKGRNFFDTVLLVNAIRKSIDLPPYFPEGYVRDDLFDELTEDVTDAQLAQRPATYTFEMRDFKIAAEPQTGELSHTPLATDFHSAVAEKSREAMSRLQKSNSPMRTRLSIERLLEALGDDLAHVRPGLLLMRYRSVQADLVAIDTPENRNEVSTEALACLHDVVASIEDLMGCFPQLADIEAERLAQKIQDADVPAILDYLSAIKEAAADSDAVSQSAMEALEAGDEIILEKTQEIEWPNWSFNVATAIKVRAKTVGQKLLDYRNFCASVLHHTNKELSEVGGKSWDEVKKVASSLN